jgi:hypothetical protein
MYDVGNIYSEFRASLKSVCGSDTVAENSRLLVPCPASQKTPYGASTRSTPDSGVGLCPNPAK